MEGMMKLLQMQTIALLGITVIFRKINKITPWGILYNLLLASTLVSENSN